jgi:hypothetical protein
MTADDRYCRQQRLPQVGARGQQRLQSASAIVAAGASARIELSYLQRAGFRKVFVTSLHRPEPFPHAALFRHAAAKTIAAGAWRALDKIALSLKTP